MAATVASLAKIYTAQGLTAAELRTGAETLRLKTTYRSVTIFGNHLLALDNSTILHASHYQLLTY